MNTKLLTGLLFVVLLLVGTAQAALQVGDIIPDTLSGNMGDTLSGAFSITNTGISEVKATVSFDKFTITSKGTIPNSAFSYTPQPLVTIAAGAKTDVTYKVIVPLNTYSGTYNGVITVTDNSNSANKGTGDLALFVAKKEGLTTSTPTKITLVQGKESTINFTLTNTGNSDLTSISATEGDLVSGSNTMTAGSSIVEVTAEPVSVSYDLAKQATKEYQLKVLAGKDQAPGIYTGEVSFKTGSLESKGAVTVEVIQASDVLALTSTAGQIKLKSSAVATNNQIQLTLTNTGTLDETVSLPSATLVSGSNSMQVTPDKASVTVLAGQSATVKYTANGQTFAVGSYTGDLTLTYAGTKTVKSNLQYSVSIATLAITLPTSVSLPSVAEDRGKDVVTTFTIKNNGEADLTNLVVETKNVGSQYTIKFSTDGIFFGNPLGLGTLKSGSSIDVQVSGKIPDTETFGQHKIGDISVTTSETGTKTTELDMNVKTFLRIEKVTMDFDTSSDTTTANGNTIDNSRAKPGSKFSVKVKVCNRFPSNGQKIKDIDVEGTWVEIDNGNDITGSASTFDLSGDNCKDVTLDMDSKIIPYFADQQKYNFLIEVSGEDKNSTTHKDTWTIPVQINREDNKADMQIFKTDLKDETVSCGDDVTLNVVAYNVGTDGNDDGKLSITSSQLDIGYSKSFDFGSDVGEDCNAIDESDQQCLGFDKTFTFPVSKDVAPGKYTISVETFKDTTKSMDKKDVSVEVKSCGTSSVQTTPVVSTTSGTTGTQTAGTTSTISTTTNTPVGTTSQVAAEPVVILTTPQQPLTPALTQATPPTRVIDLTQTNIDENNTYMILLIVANVLLLVLLIVAIVKSVRK